MRSSAGSWLTVDGSAWDLGTPCEGWDGGPARRARGRRRADDRRAPPRCDRRGGSAAGGDAGAGRGQHALRDGGPRGRDRLLRAGCPRAHRPPPHRRRERHPAAGFRVGDLTADSWDLARAVAADELLDPELGAAVWDDLEPLAPMIGSIGVFGDGPSATSATGRATASAPRPHRTAAIGRLRARRRRVTVAASLVVAVAIVALVVGPATSRATTTDTATARVALLLGDSSPRRPRRS